MQIRALHKNIYKAAKKGLFFENIKPYLEKYLPNVEKWQKLKGIDHKTKQSVVGISRATYYRHKQHLQRLRKGTLPPSKRPIHTRKPCWSESQRQLVLQIRKENPTYGKAKIAVILKRDYSQKVSESTVGRIIKSLIQQGLVTLSVSFSRRKRARKFNKHAKPWSANMKRNIPGQMVQIDHMSVHQSGISGKHFQAWDYKSKFIHANLYSKATSLTAKKFLLELLEISPFKIKSVQVDGGSEFMKDFEECCKEEGLDLYVLPPRRPQYNGGVERGNRIFREEYYNQASWISIGGVREGLKKALKKYNNFRPHHALKGLTPMEYINNICH